MKLKICGCFPIKHLHFQIIVPYSWRYLSMENPMFFSVFLLKYLCFPVKITIFSRFAFPINFFHEESHDFFSETWPDDWPDSAPPGTSRYIFQRHRPGLARARRGMRGGRLDGDSLPKSSEIEKNANFWRDFPPEMATN